MRVIILLLTLGLTSSSFIPYQAHGFNDLPYMMQLIKKGVTYFKMDVSPATKDSCLLYSEWKQSQNECEILSNGFEICCLAFRGDTGSIPIFKQPFNITSEFIKTIRKHEQYFQKNSDTFYREKKVFAFNFQYDDVFSKQTKQFMLELIEILNEYNVEILIGSDSFIDSYEKKCLISCDSTERKIANANFYLQTSSIERRGDRDWNYNTFYDNIDELCDIGWPDWIGKFDAIFWEPSHEYQVQKIREKFYDPNCKISTNVRENNMFRIASNLEPETLQIFWKQPVTSEIYDSDDQKRIHYGSYSNPKIEYDNINQNFIVAYEVGSGILITQLAQDHYIISEKWLENQKLKQLKVSNNILLLQTQAQALFYEITQKELKLINTINNSENQLISISEQYFIIATIAAPSITFDFYDIVTNEHYGNTDILNDKLIYKETISISFDAISQNNEWYLVISYTPISAVELIYLLQIQINNQYEVTKLTNKNNFIDFGKSNEVKLYELNNEVYIIEIHQNGICQSAILLNNNEQNKCGHYDYNEYLGLVNSKYMLNYFYGKFSDIFERTEQGNKINGCDNDIMHGKLGNGNNPSVTMSNNQLFVVTEFVHFSELPSLTMLFCGSSNDYNNAQKEGLLYFSFDILDPKLF